MTPLVRSVLVYYGVALGLVPDVAHVTAIDLGRPVGFEEGVELSAFQATHLEEAKIRSLSVAKEGGLSVGDED